MKCEANFTHSLSKLCLEAWQNHSTEALNQTEACYPEDIDNDFTNFLALWFLVCSVFGVFGNLLTLIAIPYAAYKNRFNLNLNWSTSVFVLNLAFADLMTFVVNLPIFPILKKTKEWTLGLQMCILSTNIRYGLAYANWMSVAMIAVSRYLVTKDTNIFESRKYRILVILCIWLYGFGLLIPTDIGIFGEIGYNCQTGNCYFIPEEHGQLRIPPSVVIESIAYGLPSLIIVACYSSIWFYMWKSKRILKNNSTNQISYNLQESRTTWTLFIVCFCFFIFVTPRFVTKILSELQLFSGKSWVYLGTYILYWLHYAVNFFIFAARSGQYKKAYVLFFEEVQRTISKFIFCRKIPKRFVINVQLKPRPSTISST